MMKVDIDWRLNLPMLYRTTSPPGYSWILHTMIKSSSVSTPRFQVDPTFWHSPHHTPKLRLKLRLNHDPHVQEI